MRIAVWIWSTMVLASCSQEQDRNIAACFGGISDSSSRYSKNVQLRDWINSNKRKGYPGFALAVLDDANGLWVGAAGYASIESHIQMQICHLHHSASISKMYIAVTVLKLSERSIVELNAKALQYLPAGIPKIANIHDVTVMQLLNHSSGIPDFVDDLMSYIEAFNNPFVNNSWKDYLNKYVTDKDPVFKPGAAYQYSNTNYLLLGLIIEGATGITLGDAVQSILLSPYGLHETHYKSSPGYPNVRGVTENYFSHYDRYIQNGTRIQQHLANIAMGHEGIIASPHDYVSFLDKLMRGQILQPETLRSMTTFHRAKDREVEYGLGIMRRKVNNVVIIGHNGGGFGTMTYLFFIPENNVTIFFAANIGSLFATPQSDWFYDDLLTEIIQIVND